MTREEWEIVRELPEIPMEAWFDYYKDRGGTLNDRKQFNEVFTTLLWNRSIVTTKEGKMKALSFESAVRNMYEYYNNKFYV